MTSLPESTVPMLRAARQRLIFPFVIAFSITALSQGRDCDTAVHACAFHGFTVHVILYPPEIKYRLIQRGETVLVAANIVGTPKSGTPAKYIRELWLRGKNEPWVWVDEVKAEAEPGTDVKVPDFALDSRALERIDEQGPKIVINVTSGFKSSAGTLLSCGAYVGPLSDIEDGSVSIFCTMPDK